MSAVARVLVFCARGDACNSSTTLTQTAADIGAEYGVETLRVIGDLTVPDDVTRIVDETIEKFGRIDILVHNAGGNIRAGGAGGHPDPDDAIDIAIEDVEAVLGSNLTSTILICKAVAAGTNIFLVHSIRNQLPLAHSRPSHLVVAGMRARKSGKIVNISSTAGHATDGRPLYSTAKAGVNHYTKMLAQQLRPYNITCNALSPGPTRSGRWLANTGKRTLCTKYALLCIKCENRRLRFLHYRYRRACRRWPCCR